MFVLFPGNSNLGSTLHSSLTFFFDRLHLLILNAETESPNTVEVRAAASEIAVPKPDLGAKAEKERF